MCARQAKVDTEVFISGSYGTLARYRDVRRLEKIGDSTILGGSGDLSDFQTVFKYVKELT
jgi:20S proteasome subunit beta 7